MMMSLKENLKRLRNATGLSQADLANRAGVSQQVIGDIESGRTLDPRKIFEIARALGVSVGELIPDRVEVAAGIPNEPIALIPGRKDLPIYASAEGGNGAMLITFEPIDFVIRPAPLENVRDGYGIYVVGDSMVPAYDPGDLALVNPHLPPSPGRDAIFFQNDHDGPKNALIKRLVRATVKEWHVQQYNPAKTFTLQRSTWQQCHAVVGRYGR